MNLLFYQAKKFPLKHIYKCVGYCQGCVSQHDFFAMWPSQPSFRGSFPVGNRFVLMVLMCISSWPRCFINPACLSWYPPLMLGLLLQKMLPLQQKPILWAMMKLKIQVFLEMAVKNHYIFRFQPKQAAFFRKKIHFAGHPYPESNPHQIRFFHLACLVFNLYWRKTLHRQALMYSIKSDFLFLTVWNLRLERRPYGINRVCVHRNNFAPTPSFHNELATYMRHTFMQDTAIPCHPWVATSFISVLFLTSHSN